MKAGGQPQYWEELVICLQFPVYLDSLVEEFRKKFHPELPESRRNTIFPSHVYGVSAAASTNIRSATTLDERDLTAIHFDRNLKKWRRDTAKDPKPRWLVIKLHPVADGQSAPLAVPRPQLYPDPFAVIFTHQDWKNRYNETKLPTRGDLNLPIGKAFGEWDNDVKEKYCLTHMGRKKTKKGRSQASSRGKSSSKSSSSEEISTESDSDKSAATGEKDWICGQTDAASDLEATASDAYPKPTEKKKKNTQTDPSPETKKDVETVQGSNSAEASKKEITTGDKGPILTSETRRAWEELLGFKSPIDHDPQRKICEEALEATKRLTDLLTTGHSERESLREAQREAASATAKLVEERQNLILTTIARSNAVGPHSVRDSTEWEEFLSSNNRLLNLIAQKEQEERELSSDIQDFRRTAATYVSLASKVQPSVDSSHGTKESFLKAAEMLEAETQLVESIRNKVNEEINGLRFLALNPALFIRKAMESEPQNFCARMEEVFQSMAAISKRKLSLDPSKAPSGKKPKPDEKEPSHSDGEPNNVPAISKPVWEILGCKRVPTVGDGHCGYRAVSAVEFGDDSSHRRVRQELADFFDTHKDIFMSSDFIACRPEGGLDAAQLYDNLWGWLKKDPTARPEKRNWFENPWDCQLTALRYKMVVGVLQSEKSSIIRIFTPFDFREDPSTWNVAESAINYMTKKVRYKFLGLIFTNGNHWDTFTIGNDAGRNVSKAKKALLAGLVGESLENGEKGEKYKFAFVPNPRDLSTPGPSQ